MAYPYSKDEITLEPAEEANVDLLVQWTLDPEAQGPYKHVPPMTPSQLRESFLYGADRHYFLIKRTSGAKPLGRFYYREWHFHSDPEKVDWELNILIADPAFRGKGYGTTTQKLALSMLLARPKTHSVFTYTHEDNIVERRALLKAGLVEIGYLPHIYYRIPSPRGLPGRSVAYSANRILVF